LVLCVDDLARWPLLTREQGSGTQAAVTALASPSSRHADWLGDQ